MYVGAGKPPVGGNIDTGKTTLHAVCRPQELNRGAIPGDDTEEKTSNRSSWRTVKSAESSHCTITGINSPIGCVVDPIDGIHRTVFIKKSIDLCC